MRDGTEKRLIGIILAQEQFIQEIRDMSSTFDFVSLKAMAVMQPLSSGGGGVYSHTLGNKYKKKQIQAAQSAVIGGNPQHMMLSQQVRKESAFDLYFLEDLPLGDIPSIYQNQPDEDISVLASETSDDEDEMEESINPAKRRAAQQSRIVKSPLQKVQEQLHRRDDKLAKALARTDRHKLENRMLRMEFDALKGVTEQWLAERDTLVAKIQELENKLMDIRKDQSFRVAFLEAQMEDMQKDFDKKIEKFKEDKLRF